MNYTPRKAGIATVFVAGLAGLLSGCTSANKINEHTENGAYFTFKARDQKQLKVKDSPLTLPPQAQLDKVNLGGVFYDITPHTQSDGLGFALCKDDSVTRRVYGGDDVKTKQRVVFTADPSIKELTSTSQYAKDALDKKELPATRINGRNYIFIRTNSTFAFPYIAIDAKDLTVDKTPEGNVIFGAKTFYRPSTQTLTEKTTTSFDITEEKMKN